MLKTLFFQFVVGLLVMTPVAHATSTYDLSDLYPLETCALLSSPGDFILQVIKEGSADLLEFGPGVVALTRTKEVLNLKVPDGLNFSHSEVITDIQKGKNIVSWSFYPPFFSKAPFQTKERRLGFDPEPDHKPLRRYANHSATYRRDFAIYRVTKGGQSLHYRQTALNNTWAEWARDEYGQHGTCADFVNYAYGDEITDWWNFVPTLDVWINRLYPPAAISTTDDLAESPDTQKLCEVSEKTKLVYPLSIDTKTLADDIEKALTSENEAIVGHAIYVQKFLMDRGILGRRGYAQYDKIKFSKEAKVLPKQTQCETKSQRARKRFLNYRR